MTDKIKTNVIARYDYFFSINVQGFPSSISETSWGCNALFTKK